MYDKHSSRWRKSETVLKGVLAFNKYVFVSRKVCNWMGSSKQVKEKIEFGVAFYMAIAKTQVIKTGISHSAWKSQTLYQKLQSTLIH